MIGTFAAQFAAIPDGSRIGSATIELPRVTAPPLTKMFAEGLGPALPAIVLPVIEVVGPAEKMPGPRSKLVVPSIRLSVIVERSTIRAPPLYIPAPL